MAGCQAQRFDAVGPAMFACLQAKGTAAGVPIAGSQGQATTIGVTLRWDYEPTSEVLVIECLDAPFFVPCSTVTGKVSELVESCRTKAV